MNAVGGGPQNHNLVQLLRFQGFAGASALVLTLALRLLA